ncbi:MAG: transporter substrate-binding domain-containing protein [Terracidiphilus sp.]
MRRFALPLLFPLALAFALVSFAHAAASPTLDRVRAARSLSCGVDLEEPEYTLDDAHGNHSKFDAELCEAVAVAVLGREAKFVLHQYRDEADALKALKKGEIDLVAAGSPYLDNDNGSLAFGRPIFYDSQGILVNRDLSVDSAKGLEGKKICFLIGTEIERQLTAYMNRRKVRFIPGPFSEEGEMEVALVSRTCTAISADVSQLAYERTNFKGLAKDYIILPDVVATDPLAPVTLTGDPQWSAIVNWTMHALVLAEESGVTRDNVERMKKSDDLAAQRLLGVNRGWGQFLGLDDEWAARAVQAVGNYGEVFERTLGAGSPMRLERGQNRLWSAGGLLLAEPLR